MSACLRCCASLQAARCNSSATPPTNTALTLIDDEYASMVPACLCIVCAMRLARLMVVSRRLCARQNSTQGKADWKRRKDRKLVDWKRVLARGGNGGDGCVSFRREAKRKFKCGGPDGGNGGCGGGVVFVSDSSVRSLKSLKTSYSGQRGGRGMRVYRKGKNGESIVVKVPRGTTVKDSVTDTLIADLMQDGEECVVVRGGEGGVGNAMFGSEVHRRPRECTPGEDGEKRMLDVEMKTIADLGLVGFPNAGKSTLLRALSRATPTVAAYPFTTLNPHIGVMEGGGEERIAVADIPGLIPGAHDNRGLGHLFLRHVERCRSLLFVIDASSTEPDVASQLRTLQYELQCYSSVLSERAGLVVVNKMDAGNFEERVVCLRTCTALPVMAISALERWNIGALKEAMVRLYYSHGEETD